MGIFDMCGGGEGFLPRELVQVSLDESSDMPGLVGKTSVGVLSEYELY